MKLKRKEEGEGDYMSEVEEVEIDLLEIFDMLKKRWIMIVSLIIVAMGISYGYTVWSYVPMYSTSTTIVVNRQDVTSGMSSSSDFYLREDLILTFQGIINSQNLRTRVSDELDTANLGSISVSADDSSIIRIRVTHSDPEMAVEVANTTAEVFREMIKEMMYDMDSSVLDEAIVPMAAQGMNLKMNILIAAVLGGMVGAGLCFVIEFLDRTFKQPKQLTQLINIPVIGVIPDVDEKYFLN